MPTDALRSVPEFARVLADDPTGAGFAIEAHSRFLRAATTQLSNAGETLRPARTAHSDESGRFLRRSKDGGSVVHAQSFVGGTLLDWGHQTFGLNPFGVYSKSSFWLASGAGSQVPLTPHLELEVFSYSGGARPNLFYFNASPRASLALYPAYIDRYYLKAPPPGDAAPTPSRASWAQLEAACAADAHFSRFTSPSFHVRAFSPTSILFNVDAGAEGRAAVLDAIQQGTAIWGAWLAADRAAFVDALAQQAAAPASAATTSSVGSAGRAAAAAARAVASAWVLEGAPPEAGGLGSAVLASVRANDSAWRRFPRREDGAAALKAAFGDDVIEALWSTQDGSARTADAAR